VPDVLVLVPTYNEAPNIARIIERITTAAPDADVLVIDDGSPDGTGAIVEAIAGDNVRVELLRRPGKAGLGAAYLAGFAFALARGYEFVVEIDADGSHDPAELPAMLAGARGVDGAAGSDLVIGSRWVDGGGVQQWPRHRLAISRLGNRYARAALRSGVRDLTAGFRVYRASALRRIDLDGVSSQGYCFQVEMAWRLERAGCRISEHPITFVERTRGRSKMHLGIVVEALWRITVWGIGARMAPGRLRASA
jgi:dolichol-phosphate mannosyltransferase